MKRRPPHNLEPSADATAQVLTTKDGVSTWYGTPCLLIAHGASVPAGTPVRTLIFEKAV
jgi:hypothetical protein